jgi:hypothetical protein
MGTVSADVINKTYAPPFRGGYSSYDFWRTCTWAWGCLNGTWTDALRNNNSAASHITSNLPLRLQDRPLSTVIDVDYVCPVFKAKPTGGLLVSVFVGKSNLTILLFLWYERQSMWFHKGTVTMYAALYSIFIFIAPKLDQRYRKKHGIEKFSGM